MEEPLSRHHTIRLRYAFLLAVLTLLFAGRVLSQFLITAWDIPWLPPFESWYSGLVPYPILLPLQFLLILLMLRILFDFGRGTGLFVTLAPRTGTILKRLSYLYALAMLARYAVTMTLYPERRWFGGTIPIWFHFVLAAFLYLLGHYQAVRAPASEESRLR
jgi:hypothetical protein